MHFRAVDRDGCIIVDLKLWGRKQPDRVLPDRRQRCASLMSGRPCAARVTARDLAEVSRGARRSEESC